MRKIKLVLLSVMWTAVMLVFPVASGVIAAVLEMRPVNILLTQGLFMLLSLIIPFVYIRGKKIALKSAGLRMMERNRARDALYFIPAVLAELPLLFAGVDFVDFQYAAALTLFALAVGISEEMYFRGVILNLLKTGFSAGRAVVISAAVFGAGHFAGILAAENLTAVLLQVLNAAVFGIIAAEIVIITKSLLPVMIWHFSFNYINRLTLAGGTEETIALIVQETIMVLYAFYLWRKMPGGFNSRKAESA